MSDLQTTSSLPDADGFINRIEYFPVHEKTESPEIEESESDDLNRKVLRVASRIKKIFKTNEQIQAIENRKKFKRFGEAAKEENNRGVTILAHQNDEEYIVDPYSEEANNVGGDEVILQRLKVGFAMMRSRHAEMKEKADKEKEMNPNKEKEATKGGRQGPGNRERQSKMPKKINPPKKDGNISSSKN